MNECYNCGFWDSDYEGCTCPSVDKWYACPLEPEPTEKDFCLDYQSDYCEARDCCECEYREVENG